MKCEIFLQPHTHTTIHPNLLRLSFVASPALSASSPALDTFRWYSAVAQQDIVNALWSACRWHGCCVVAKGILLQVGVYARRHAFYSVLFLFNVQLCISFWPLFIYNSTHALIYQRFISVRHAFITVRARIVMKCGRNNLKTEFP